MGRDGPGPGWVGMGRAGVGRDGPGRGQGCMRPGRGGQEWRHRGKSVRT